MVVGISDEGGNGNRHGSGQEAFHGHGNGVLTGYSYRFELLIMMVMGNNRTAKSCLMLKSIYIFNGR